MLRTWRFVTLLLAALGLTVGAAHALELPPKEYGHVAAFTAWLIGFGLLVLSVLRETPAE
jgi:hypothetical protein